MKQNFSTFLFGASIGVAMGDSLIRAIKLNSVFYTVECILLIVAFTIYVCDGDEDEEK